MIGPAATAEVKATVDVRPARSQVFLVAITVLAAVSVLCGAFLFFSEINYGWLFVLFAVLLVGVGFWAWMKSQSDSDLEKAHPTNIELPDGMKITTDSRTLRSPDAISALVTLLQEVRLRRPLPDPDGFVDANAQIIPNSKGDAVALVREINNDTQATTDSLIDRLGLSDKNTHVTQKLAYSTDTGPGHDIPHGLNVTESGQECN